MKLYTSGTARRRAVDRAFSRARYLAEPVILAEINAVDHGDNPILDRLRDDTPIDHYTTVEFLFQLARLWALWQSPRIGTFPYDYRDPGGPAPRDIAYGTGEDLLYWELLDELDKRPDADDLIVHATRVIGLLYHLTEEE